MKNHEFLSLSMNKTGKLDEVLPEPHIGVGGLLFNKNQEVLLIKRNQPPAQGLWSIPGGKMEPGESMVEACRREFHEETNLDVAVKHISAVVDRQLEGFHYVIIDFYVELTGHDQQPIPQSDVLEAKWVRLDELGRYDLVSGLADIINRVYDNRTNGHPIGLYDCKMTGTDFY